MHREPPRGSTARYRHCPGAGGILSMPSTGRTRVLQQSRGHGHAVTPRPSSPQRQPCPSGSPHGTAHPGPPAHSQHNDPAVPDPAWEQREPAWARGRAGSAVPAQEQAPVAGHTGSAEHPPGTHGHEFHMDPTGHPPWGAPSALVPSLPSPKTGLGRPGHSFNHSWFPRAKLPNPMAAAAGSEALGSWDVGESRDGHGATAHPQHPAPRGRSRHVPGHLMGEFYLPCNSHTTLPPLQPAGKVRLQSPSSIPGAKNPTCSPREGQGGDGLPVTLPSDGAAASGAGMG